MFYQFFNPGGLESESPSRIILALVPIFLLVLIATADGEENLDPCNKQPGTLLNYE